MIRGGENVACPHVEAELLRHPDVREAAVLGIPHDDLGEELAATVVPVPGVDLSVAALRCPRRAEPRLLRDPDALADQDRAAADPRRRARSTSRPCGATTSSTAGRDSMLTPPDELMGHQVAFPHAVVGSSDPSWRERYWVSFQDVDGGETVLTLGLGKYPNHDVMEGFACVAFDGHQHNVRLSRRLGADSHRPARRAAVGRGARPLPAPAVRARRQRLRHRLRDRLDQRVHSVPRGPPHRDLGPDGSPTI